MAYISKIILVFGLIFLLMYFTTLVSYKLTFKRKYMNQLITALMISASSCVVMLIIHLSGLIGIPDGRFFIAGYTTYSYGPLYGILVALTSTAIKSVLDDTDVIALLISHAFNQIVYTLIWYRTHKQKKAFKYWHAGIYIFITSMAVITSAYLLSGADDYRDALKNIWIVSTMGVVLILGLLTVVERESGRRDYIKKLQEGNHSLNSYKEQVEFLAYHETQTGFKNKEMLYREFSLCASKDADMDKTLVIMSIRNIQSLHATLGVMLIETLHFVFGSEMKDRMQTDCFFSLGLGHYAFVLDGNQSSEGVNLALESIYQRLLKPFEINSLTLNVSVYIGCVTLPKQPISSEAWLDQGEIAHHTAMALDKRNQAEWFTRELEHIKCAEKNIENAIMSSLSHGDFYVVYQPQFDSAGQMVGIEVLLRWKCMDLGMISPHIFIPIAEKNGHIEALGRFVLKTVCQFIVDNHSWLHEQGKVIPLSVNVSLLELLNANYMAHFFDTISSYHVLPQWIQIEITESEFAFQFDSIGDILLEFKKKGVGIQLDDFGTGYSSLSYLGLMPVQTVKIDQVFIRRMTQDSRIRELLSLIIVFAHCFKMNVIAEGVETEEQFKWLKEQGCDGFQGYYFSKPLDEIAFHI